MNWTLLKVLLNGPSFSLITSLAVMSRFQASFFVVIMKRAAISSQEKPSGTERMRYFGLARRTF